MSRGNFFAVSKDRFLEACDIGMGPAVTYLVIACGTGRGQSRSKWSAKAIGKYAGINFARSIRFIGELEKSGLLANIGTRQKPIYELTAGDDFIWLPNTIVTGAAGETPAVWRLRQSRNIDLLELFVQLYENQNLGHHGGIHPETLSGGYECRRLGSYGAVTVWSAESLDQMRTTLDNPLANGNLKYWWELITTLIGMGLLSRSTCVFDGPATARDADDLEPDGEFVYTLDGPSTEESISEDIESYLSSRDVEWLEHLPDSHGGDLLFVVPKHIRKPYVIELYRMTHTAHTAAASTWWARIMEGRRQLNQMLGHSLIMEPAE